jgi:hypothetical protein
MLFDNLIMMGILIIREFDNEGIARLPLAFRPNVVVNGSNKQYGY